MLMRRTGIFLSRTGAGAAAAASASSRSLARRRARSVADLASVAARSSAARFLTRLVRSSHALNTALAVRWAVWRWRSAPDRGLVMAIYFQKRADARKRKGGLAAAPCVSDGLQVAGLGAARIRLDVELDLLAFVQAAHAGRFDGGDMDEHVLAAVIGRDEAKTLGGIEELDGSDSHEIFLFSHRMTAVRNAPRCGNKNRGLKDVFSVRSGARRRVRERSKR